MEALNITNISSLLLNTTKGSYELLEKKDLSHHDPPWLVLLRVTVLGIVLSLGILGNSLVILCISRIKEMRTVTGVFLVNLAVSDLGVASICVPVAIAASVDSPMLGNPVLCNLNGFSLVFFFLASIQTLSAISVHKYITVVFAMRTTVTKNRARVVLAIVWIISLVLATGPTIGWSQYEYSPGRHQCSPKTPKSIGGYSHMASLLSFGYIIPVITMTFCYSRLYCTSRKHMRRLRANAITNDNEGTSERDLINTLVIILLGFIVCWLPFVVYIVYGMQDLPIPFYMPSLAFLFGYGNSALNPIIYALRHKSFRKGFREVLTICFRAEVRQKYATATTLMCKDSPMTRSHKSRRNVDGNKNNGVANNGQEMQSIVLLKSCWEDEVKDRENGNDVIIKEIDA